MSDQGTPEGQALKTAPAFTQSMAEQAAETEA